MQEKDWPNLTPLSIPELRIFVEQCQQQILDLKKAQRDHHVELVNRSVQEGLKRQNKTVSAPVTESKPANTQSADTELTEVEQTIQDSIAAFQKKRLEEEQEMDRLAQQWANGN